MNRKRMPAPAVNYALLAWQPDPALPDAGVPTPLTLNELGDYILPSLEAAGWRARLVLDGDVLVLEVARWL
jgi:hypothetical protein